MIQHETWSLNIDLVAEQMDPFSLQELRRLFNPRVNRRVKTSQIVMAGFDKRPGFENPNLLGLAEFWKDGWSAFGTVSRNENGNIVVQWHTAWSREIP